jgi:UMF1 family MFS transporter
LLGLVVGSTQSICRGLYARLVPQEQAGELFGFHTLVSRLSAILGPMTYGLISATTNNQRLAMFALVLFLLTGGWIVLKVPMPAKN